MSDDQLHADMRRASLNWLARREHSVREISDRLRRRFGDDAPVQTILDWLTGQNFLDDRRFAGVFMRSRIERGQGPLRLRQELQQRGLSETLIEEALAEAECDWFALAASTRARRFRKLPGADRKEKARQLRFLQYRGFTSEQCFAALDGADDSDELGDPADSGNLDL